MMRDHGTKDVTLMAVGNTLRENDAGAPASPDARLVVFPYGQIMLVLTDHLQAAARLISAHPFTEVLAVSRQNEAHTVLHLLARLQEDFAEAYELSSSEVVHVLTAVSGRDQQAASVYLDHPEAKAHGLMMPAVNVPNAVVQTSRFFGEGWYVSHAHLNGPLRTTPPTLFLVRERGGLRAACLGGGQ